MLFLIILAGLTICSFFAYFIKKGCTRESYLLFVVYSLPMQGLGVTAEAYGGLKVFDALAYFSLIFFFKNFINVSRKNRIYSQLFGLLIFILFAGSLHSDFIKHSLLSILSVFPIFIFTRLLLRELSVNPGLSKKMIWGFQLAFFIGAFFMIMQLIMGMRFTFYPDLNPNIATSEGIRYPGFFGDAQMNALFIAMVSFLFLIRFKDIRKPALVNFILFGAAIFAVLLSGGRASFLGICVGSAFLVIFFPGRVRYFIGGAAIAAIAIIPFIKDSFLLIQRFQKIDEGYQFRSYIWKEAYDIYSRNKILGIGIGNYKDYVGRFSPDQYYVLEDNSILILDQPENGYLKIATEAGLFGFIITFLLIVIPIVKAMYSHIAIRKNYLVLLFIASVLCWFVSFNSLYTLSDRRIIIVLASLLCFIIKPADDRAVEEVNLHSQ